HYSETWRRRSAPRPVRPCRTRGRSCFLVSYVLLPLPEHRELPGVGSLIVADEIRITVCAFQLEISVVGRQPGVEHLRDGYPMVTKNQLAWRLLAAMTCVALDTDAEQPLFRHLIHRTPSAQS